MTHVHDRTTTVPMAVPTPHHLGDGVGSASTSAGHSFSTTSCFRGPTIYGRSAPAGTFSPLLAHVSHTGRIGALALAIRGNLTCVCRHEDLHRSGTGIEARRVWPILTALSLTLRRYSSKADVFSLGIVLFELFYIFPTKMERSKVLSGALAAGRFPSLLSDL